MSLFRLFPGRRFVKISTSSVGRNGYKTSALHAGPGGAGRSLSRHRRSRDGGRWVSRPAAMRLSRGMGVDFSCAGAGVCAGVWSWSLCVGGAWCAGARVVTRRVAHGPGACAVLDVAGDLH